MTQPYDPEEVAQLAVNLARNCGYATFPVSENKIPTVTGGFHRASKFPDEIRTLWKTNPGPLIGIATGETSGIDVLDVDPQHPTAPAWLAAAKKRGLPSTRIYATRSGGQHCYFEHAPGVRNSQSKLAHGIDVRGDGGYVVHWFAAGYFCEDHSPPAPWPAWLLECVTWKPPPAPVPPSTEPHNPDAAIDGILRFVSHARQGERNASLHWAACRMAERVQAGQIARTEAENLLTAAARTAGLEEIRVRRTLDSAWKAAAR